ncbi:MAG: PQQ-binding-like beta-propeller repeat protein [Lentisphaerae bacterium]|nr:PQQ-binding-like beta-propeller repeat protein [Lentisphaerota bacterium]
MCNAIGQRRRLAICGVWLVIGAAALGASNIPSTVTFQVDPQHTGQSPYNGPRAPVLKWRFQVPGTTGSHAQVSGPVVDGNNLVYFCGHTNLFVIDTNGALQRSWTILDLGELGFSPAGDVLYTMGSNKVTAFSLSGQQLWAFTNAGGPFVNEPCAASNGVIYVGNTDTYVYSIDPTNGTQRWRFKADGAFAPFTAPSLSFDQAVVYVGSGDPNFTNGGTVFALNGATGAMLWSNHIDNVRASGVTVMSNGNLLATAQGAVRCLAPNTGVAIWTSTPNVCSSLKGALSSTGIYGVGNASGTVYALSTANGQALWSYQTGANPNYDPTNPHDPQYGVLTAPIFGADGVLYVGAVDGKMYAVNTNGQALWTYATGAALMEKCPAIGADGVLYFASSDGYLYALGDPHTNTTPAAIGLPTNVAAGDGTDRLKIVLQWAAASNASGYRIFRATSNDTALAAEIGTASVTNYGDTSTFWGVYTYWVKATNAAGSSDFSASDTGRRGGLPPGYDADASSDLAVFDQNTGNWYIRTVSGTILAWNQAWGWPGAVPVAGDYNLEGLSDLAVFDQNTGFWYIRTVSGTTLGWAIPWGWPGAEPVSGDYDGDGISDLAVFDQNTGYWYIRTVSDTTLGWAIPWGWPGADPVSGDYDGDGIGDLAVFDQTTGKWYIRTVSGTTLGWALEWGWPGADPASGAAW